MKVKIDSLNWHEFRELYKVTEYRDGEVSKTKRVGFVKASYEPQKDEIVSPLSTSLFTGGEIELIES
jgi:hypothetical protein